MRRTGVSKPNLAAAVVRLAGGPGAAATICGVSRQTIYDWIKWAARGAPNRRAQAVSRLRVAIENLAGDEVEKLAAPFIHHAPSAGRSVSHPTNLASFQDRIST